MPLKECPKCHMKHGVRRLKCDCGYDFACKRSGKAAVKAGTAPHPLYPEPGGWVLDKMRGMPDIDPPEPLPPGQIDTVSIQDIISYDGLGYAIYTFIPADRIADSKLRKLWKAARDAMQHVVEYLDEDLSKH